MVRLIIFMSFVNFTFLLPISIQHQENKPAKFISKTEKCIQEVETILHSNNYDYTHRFTRRKIRKWSRIIRWKKKLSEIEATAFKKQAIRLGNNGVRIIKRAFKQEDKYHTEVGITIIKELKKTSKRHNPSLLRKIERMAGLKNGLNQTLEDLISLRIFLRSQKRVTKKEYSLAISGIKKRTKLQSDSLTKTYCNRIINDILSKLVITANSYTKSQGQELVVFLKEHQKLFSAHSINIFEFPCETAHCDTIKNYGEYWKLLENRAFNNVCWGFSKKLESFGKSKHYADLVNYYRSTVLPYLKRQKIDPSKFPFDETWDNYQEYFVYLEHDALENILIKVIHQLDEYRAINNLDSLNNLYHKIVPPILEKYQINLKEFSNKKVISGYEGAKNYAEIFEMMTNKTTTNILLNHAWEMETLEQQHKYKELIDYYKIIRDSFELKSKLILADYSCERYFAESNFKEHFDNRLESAQNSLKSQTIYFLKRIDEEILQEEHNEAMYLVEQCISNHPYLSFWGSCPTMEELKDKLVFIKDNFAKMYIRAAVKAAEGKDCEAAKKLLLQAKEYLEYPSEAETIRIRLRC